jgi:hypothetical protein
VKTPTMRDRARHRLKRPEDIDPAEWAKMEDARQQGFQLLRFPGVDGQDPAGHLAMATRGYRPTMLATMAKARRARLPFERWVPTEEESRAIADGTLTVIPCIGGPIYIDLRD